MRTFLIIGVFLLQAGAMFAAPVTDTYVIPLAGHLDGANGETWTTEVIVHNLQSTTLVVDLAAVGSGDDTVRTVSVGAHATVALGDLFQPGSAGALVVAGSAPFALRARVHTDGPRGSLGADIAPVTEFIDAGSEGAFLPGLAASARHRSSIGFLAIADTDLSIEVTMIDESGATIGTRVFMIEGGEIAHVHSSSGAITPGLFENATARVRITSGQGLVTAYGTVVENLSSDAAFVAPAHGGASPSQLRHVIQKHRIRGKR